MKNKKKLLKDHRKLNFYLNLYHISKMSPGVIFWHNNGWIILQKLKSLLRKKFKKFNYYEVNSSSLINKNIWKKTGHWDNYKNSIFCVPYKNNKLCLKPMNCPGHIDIYKQTIKSYKNLPIKYSEFGVCYRNEDSGSLHGLMRTKVFTQDDAHIFCTKKQIQKEISNCIDMTFEVYKIFKFKIIKIYLSTKPIKYIGDDFIWNKAENILIKILKKKKIKYKIKIGEGAFYGPKIEFVLKDSFNREWQCGTIQLDFYLSEKLKIFYINKKNKKKTPIIIHRAILGSLERFIGILIEEYNGWLPLWLTPIQVVVINVSKKHKVYSLNVFNTISLNKIKVIKNFKNKNINFKIREHTLQKIPYIVICGNEEINKNKISIRNYSNKIIKNINLEKFIKKIKFKIKNKI